MKVTIQDSKTSVTVRPRDFKVTVSGARGPQGPQGDPGQGGEWGTIVGDITEQTDLYTALEDKVPYTGATGDLNLGEQKLLFANASELREGTYDFGGQGGISQICSVGFENNWQSGFNHIFDNNGLIRESLHCFDIVPDSSFDLSLRFKVGSLWKLDDGTIYECVDATIGAAVWQLYNPYATDISGLVPYTGATQDVNLGEYGAQLGNLEFDTTPTNVPTTAGSVYWNDTDGTLNIVLKGGQTISRVGETQHIRALNNTGAQIARGKVVYVLGAQGQRLTIALADADTEILSKDTIGFTAEAIADGAEGFVIVQGVINNVSTTGMADGATVFLSQTAGSYTTTPPADPAHLVVLGFIVNGGSGGAGSIYVKVDNGYELEELHGVADAAKVTPVGDDALLLRDSADNNLWKRLTWTNALAGVKSHMDTFKSVAGGYASLDGSGKVPSSELPSYVDDVVEVANYAALPGTGETGKIYVTLDTNKCYRWTGSVYVEVSAGGASAWGAITGTLSNQTDLQTALDGKVDENLPITGATKTKITYDAKGLVTAGADAAIADITGLQTALDGKQATLSLTTTGTSGAATLVGSTLNIPQYQGVLTNPVTGTGTAGQVAYFNGTSAVTGSANLFWDAANGRLGVGTASPSERLSIQTTTSSATNNIIQAYSNSGAQSAFRVTDQGTGIFRNYSSISPLAANGYGAVGSNYYMDGNATRYTIGSDSASAIEFQSGGFVFKTAPSGVVNSIITFTSVANLTRQGDLGLGISTTTPSARLHVRGSGTTSATTALLVQNSTPSELFKVLDNGAWNFNGDGIVTGGIDVRKNTGTVAFFGATDLSRRLEVLANGNVLLGLVGWIPTTDGGNSTTVGAGGCFIGYNATGDLAYSGVASVTLGRPLNRLLNATSGQQQMVDIVGNFSPTSGTATFYDLSVKPTINQTGGANGITRGLYVNPTLTAAADWRSIETSNNTGYAAYFAGSADLFLGNGTDIQIGTTTGTKIGTATNQLIGLWNATPIAQPTTAVAAATRVGGAGNTVTDTDTFDGYTIAQLVKALRNMGALA